MNEELFEMLMIHAESATETILQRHKSSDVDFQLTEAKLKHFWNRIRALVYVQRPLNTQDLYARIIDAFQSSMNSKLFHAIFCEENNVDPVGGNIDSDIFTLNQSIHSKIHILFILKHFYSCF